MSDILLRLTWRRIIVTAVEIISIYKVSFRKPLSNRISRPRTTSTDLEKSTIASYLLNSREFGAVNWMVCGVRGMLSRLSCSLPPFGFARLTGPRISLSCPTCIFSVRFANRWFTMSTTPQPPATFSSSGVRSDGTQYDRWKIGLTCNIGTGPRCSVQHRLNFCPLFRSELYSYVFASRSTLHRLL
jgi:hypothetical protein